MTESERETPQLHCASGGWAPKKPSGNSFTLKGTLFSARVQVVAVAGKFHPITLMEPHLYSQVGGPEKTSVIHPNL